MPQLQLEIIPSAPSLSVMIKFLVWCVGMSGELLLSGTYQAIKMRPLGCDCLIFMHWAGAFLPGLSSEVRSWSSAERSELTGTLHLALLLAWPQEGTHLVTGKVRSAGEWNHHVTSWHIHSMWNHPLHLGSTSLGAEALSLCLKEGRCVTSLVGSALGKKIRL